MIRYVILGLLRHGASRHGYALMREYGDASGLQASVGNFYRELQRLHAAGMVRPVKNPPEADPRRLPYETTTAGANEFDAWLSRRKHGGICTYEDVHSLRTLLALGTSPDDAVRVLEHWRVAINAERELLESSRDEGGVGDDARHAGKAIWIGRRLRHLAIDLEFVDSLQGSLVRDDSRHHAAETKRSTPRQRSRSPRSAAPPAGSPRAEADRVRRSRAVVA